MASVPDSGCFSSCPGQVNSRIHTSKEFAFGLPSAITLVGDLKLRKKTRTRLPQVRWTKHGYLCLHLLDIALYHDIETNPGPKAKPKCGSCEKTI